jgi:hypothetical protein
LCVVRKQKVLSEYSRAKNEASSGGMLWGTLLGQRDTARATLFCDNAVLNTSSHCLQDTYQWLALEEHTNDDGKVQEAHTPDAKTQYFGNPKLSDVKHAAVCAWSPSNPC